MKSTEFDKWVPARPAFEAACKKFPQLNLTGSAGSWIWFQRMALPHLEDTGVAARIPGRRYVVDSTRFEAEFFHLIVSGDYRTKLPKGFTDAVARIDAQVAA